MMAISSASLVVGLDDDDRDVVNAGLLRGSPAPLAGDDLVGVGGPRVGPDDNRLDDALLADRIGQFCKMFIVERAPRVARVGPNEFDRYALLPGRAGARRLFRGRIANERREAPSEAEGDFFSHSKPLWLRGAQSTFALDDFGRSFRYAWLPVHFRSYRSTGLPCEGASETRTLRGMTVS